MTMSYQNLSICGLGTVATISVPDAGPHFVDGKLQLPTLVGGGGASAVVVVVNVNGSPVYTGPAGAEGFHIQMLNAASDIITVVLSSAAAADKVTHAIKGEISFSSGG